MYLLAHDLGTSGNKATLFHEDGRLVASTLCEYPTHYPGEGQVEQNPEDWWQAVCRSTRTLMAQSAVQPGDIAAISFSGQMMGCLLVDQGGAPLGNALIWADTRSWAQEAWMIRQAGMEAGYRITGHRLSASYGAAKLLWIRDNQPLRYAKAYKMLGAKDFIIHRMVGRFVTDYSDASSTNLFDLEQKTWAGELLRAFEIDPGLMPEAYPSATIAGTLQPDAADAMGLMAGIPVVIGGGDGSCACVGAGAVQPGEAYCVLGSSAWISTVSPVPVMDDAMRTFNWVHLDPACYTPCGTMQAAGYSYQWFCKRLMEAEDYDRLNQLAAASPPGSNGVVYLPYLLGERSPRWDLAARGAFIGLSGATRQGDMARAVMEGVGFNLKIILDILQGALPLRQLTVIGGGAQAKHWMQILADIWQQPLTLQDAPREATSMGAAVCAGVGVGMYRDYTAVAQFARPVEVIHPRPQPIYQQLAPVFEAAYTGLMQASHLLAAIRRGESAADVSTSPQ